MEKQIGTFGTILESKRKRKELTVKKLAELSGMSATAIGSWERDAVSPTLENAAKALKPLGYKLQIVRI